MKTFVLFWNTCAIVIIGVYGFLTNLYKIMHHEECRYVVMGGVREVLVGCEPCYTNADVAVAFCSVCAVAMGLWGLYYVIPEMKKERDEEEKDE